MAGPEAYLLLASSEATLHAKEIAYRGGVVTFNIPDGWVDEYEPDGGGSFYFPSADSGTFRLNILTFEKPSGHGAKSLEQYLAEGTKALPKSIRSLPNGNALGESVSRTSEDGEKITLYWWYVASFVPPNHLRIANFSYTVLSSSEGTPGLEGELLFLLRSVEAARFAPIGGE